MTDHQGDLTARLHDVAATLEDLDILLRGEEPLQEVLHRLVQTAVRTIPDAAAVSVTVVEGRGGRTVATTDDAIVPIDAGQYDEGDGPCLEAARQRSPVRVSIEEVRDRWPLFVAAAAAVGMRSYLSAPLLLQDEENVVRGALNLYGRRSHAFGSLDEALITLFATAASSAIGNANQYLRARELAANMSTALASRAEIDQAKGVLMARHGVSADQAFDLLARQSQRSNTRLRDVARALLASVTSAPDVTGTSTAT